MALGRIKKAFSWRYRRFVQRQGYVVMTVVCAAIIAGSAAWTQQAGFKRLSPEPHDDAASAAELWQESLQDVATPTPAPTQAPAAWQAPVATISVAQGFDAEKLVPSRIPGLWRVHDAVDLAAEPGEPVLAMRDGTVLETSETSVTIDHGDGFVAEYGELGDVLPAVGQPVKAGNIIGYASSEGCLHLRVTQDGVSIDPLTLLTSSQP